MHSRRTHEPRVFRLSSSVGICGTNVPKDVKDIQEMLAGSGYELATGRTLAANGHCDAETTAAIRWYQRLLNMSPSGLVQPTDTWFIEAINESRATHSRRKYSGGPLTVNPGQLTFDAEGVDCITVSDPFRQHQSPYFSRILQWPQTSSSGVTLGRGYDMGNRSAGEIYCTLREAGLEEYKSVICSKAEHLKGRHADLFVKAYGPLVGEITYEQQIKLFYLAYRVKLNEAKNLYKRVSVDIQGAPAWDKLDQKIRDVIVDIFYQGVHNVRDLFKAAIKGKTALIDHIRNSSTYMSFESHRHRIRYLQ